MIQVMVEIVYFFWFVIYVVFALAYLAKSKYKLNRRSLLLFLFLGLVALWIYYGFSSFILNMATPPGKDVNAYVRCGLYGVWFVVPYLASMAGLRFFNSQAAKMSVILTVLSIISLLITVFPLTRLRLFVGPIATNVHEYQKFGGWGNIHLLRAQMLQEDYYRIIKQWNYKPAPPDYTGLGPYADLKWWDIMSWDDPIYYDPESSPLTRRLLTYVNGCIYYCEFEMD